MGQDGTPQPQTLHTVFAYGTLKRDFPNHFFLRQSNYVGQGRTVERYALFADEFPFVYPGDAVCRIRGEVYKVDGHTLERLDTLEGHPDHYRRSEIEVRLDSGERMRAWIYFYPRRGERLVSSGEFKPTTRLGREKVHR